MTPGKGFVVHIETCNNIAEIRRKRPNEIIPARWSDAASGEFDTLLRLQVETQKGVIAEIAATVTSVDAGIENIKVEEKSAQLSSVVAEVSVRDRNHLARLMRRLRRIRHVHGLSRVVK
jgi:(p)ppGpp synthase/HD superfamily hydrolase